MNNNHTAALERPLGQQAPATVPMAETQAKMDRRARAALIRPDEAYTLADRLEEQATRFADRPLLMYGTRRLSYAEVDARANQVARVLADRGLSRGDVCALAMENRPEFFCVWFGMVKLGVVVAFINTQISGAPLAHALATTEAKAAVVGQECLDNFLGHDADADAERPALPLWLLEDPELAPPASLPEGVEAALGDALEAASSEAVPASWREGITAETPTLLIFTSGTTGLPKAAIYSHMRWLSSGDVMVETIGAAPEDVFYCCLPLYHGAAATSVTSTALKAGAAIAVRRKFSVREFWPDLRRYGVTVCQYIGEICRYLLNHQAEAGDHRLRCMMGAGLTAESWRRWVARFGHMDIYEGWGSTEANTNLINLDNRVGACGRVPDWDKTNFRLIRFDLESETHVRDEAGFCIPCEVNEVGEGVGMILDQARFEGYTSPEATEQKILRNVFREGDAYWRSGDLLRYDEDRYFYFVDRIGDTFRWKSENVSTQEVAAALDDFAGAELINIYGVRVPEHEGRAGMAAIVMQPGEAFDPDAFYALTERRLPRYAAPLFVRVASDADMTTTFKLRKVDLQRQGYDPERCGDPLYLRDDRAGTYRPYSRALLDALGLPPFQG
ncbi:MAG: long-chain-acyl-CoA synthetase [Halomonas sp.]|nr:long-chain-acyl-CoA synthetase [Halomonas sp.]